MAKERPSPEKSLQNVREEEKLERHGKLKIYLGAAPGVGKTYTMLQDALAKRAQGLDVVVGVVEAHGRKEIEELLKNLEILPRQKIEYRNKQLTEFDLDAALKRDPAVILIDEMAHTNIPGLRHDKRWQDIKEILDHGIDVYTTLNVQHIESLNDIVAQIVGIRVKETIPDSMLEIANTIELVDLPPEDLLKRLQEGKVYVPEQAELAGHHFFRKGNLIALRELALRVTAERVEAQVLLYRQGEGIERIWPTKERIMVCVGPGSQSLKAIRTARRMAVNIQGEWVAVHVQAPRLHLSEAQRNSAIENLRLAERLGAETQILTGFDVVKEILSFARERNITRIVIGKQIRPRWKEWLFGGLVDELVRKSDEIDMYIVHQDAASIKSVKPLTKKYDIPWLIYGISMGVVAIATIINFFLFPHLIHTNILIMIYLLSVTLVALFGRMGPSILASILSVLVYDFFFIPPRYSFAVANIQYFFTIIVMLLVSLIISYLTILMRRQAKIAQVGQRRTASLNLLTRQLASSRGVDKLLDIAVHYIADAFDSEVMALLPENNHLTVRAKTRADQTLSDKENSVAQWVYDLGQMAGLGTDTLSFSDAIYLPLSTSRGSVGVLRVRPTQPQHLFTPEQMHLLEGSANQIALALEVDRLEDQAKKSELQAETDRVRNALLRSVSHDIRTPIVTVMGYASTLTEMADELDKRKIKKLGNDIYFESEQLSRLINNLLQMTYLETHAVKLEKELYALDEIITLSMVTLSKQLKKKTIHIKLPNDLPKIRFDKTLIQAVFINLIDNAIKFTPPETPIDISAIVEKDNVLISVEDRGPGIVLDEVNKLFEKFYRGRMLTSEHGLGLGLAICHSIVKAHGGEIWAENRAGGGAAFRFTLPLVNTLTIS